MAARDVTRSSSRPGCEVPKSRLPSSAIARCAETGARSTSCAMRCTSASTIEPSAWPTTDTRFDAAPARNFESRDAGNSQNQAGGQADGEGAQDSHSGWLEYRIVKTPILGLSSTREESPDVYARC